MPSVNKGCDMEFVHNPVMPNEVLTYLVPKRENALMVDCTTGEGGHTKLFLEKYPALKVIGLDCDASIQEKAKTRLAPFGDRFEPKHVWFDEFWKNYSGPEVDIVLFDLGISVFHYEESKRGFSLRKSEELDMRLDENAGLSAWDVVNTYPEKELADIIFRYGEERYSRRIASAICNARQEKKIDTTDRLADVIYRSVPQEYRHLRFHPATKTFQAIRIEVNGELDRIQRALEGAVKALRPGGRVGVITFHSLEDRPVKWFFREHKDELEIITRKPVVPTEEECKKNAPSRSAKFRVAERRGV